MLALIGFIMLMNASYMVFDSSKLFLFLLGMSLIILGVF